MSTKKPVCPGMWVEDPKVTLARNLRRLLKKWQKKTGRSNKAFCRLSGVYHSTLYYILNGGRWPEPETLRKIASTLGVPVEVLFRR